MKTTIAAKGATLEHNLIHPGTTDIARGSAAAVPAARLSVDSAAEKDGAAVGLKLLLLLLENDMTKKALGRCDRSEIWAGTSMMGCRTVWLFFL
jgi:hypothetical protein